MGSPQNKDSVADLAGEVVDDQPQPVALGLAHDQAHKEMLARPIVRRPAKTQNQMRAAGGIGESVVLAALEVLAIRGAIYSPRGLGFDGAGGTDAPQVFAPHLPQVVGLY